MSSRLPGGGVGGHAGEHCAIRYTTRGCLFGSTKGNSLIANDVSFQNFLVQLQSEHIQAVGKPEKIIFGMNMAYSFRICSRPAGVGDIECAHLV